MLDKFNPNFYAHLADDSAMIQAAVDAAAETGDAVTIPRHNARTGKPIWDICRAILLYSGSIVYLDNCHLRQADGINTNIFRNSNNDTPAGFTREGRQRNISIIGLGHCLLDGGEHTGVTEDNYKEKGVKTAFENCMINFANVERIKIRDINITHHRYWSMVFHYCSHGQISGIDFYGPYHWRNQDGINLRSGCSHFNIENLTGVTGDDIVALTNLRNYYAEPMAPCGYDDSIHNVVIRNIRATTRNSFVRLLNHGGRKIYNVLIQDIMFDCESDPCDPRPGQFVKAGEYVPLHPEIYKFKQDYGIRIGTYNYYRTDTVSQLGDLYNITIRNITCRGLVGVCLSCAAQDILIDNVRMYGNGLTGVFFAHGYMRNVVVRDVNFAPNDAPYEWNESMGGVPHDNRSWECEKYMNNDLDYATLPDRQLCAVYFKETNGRDLVFQGIHGHKNQTSVFGGFGDVKATVSGVVKPDDLPLNGGAHVGIDIQEI
ncbi:MAG: hypothetical protein E7421_05500 [Ruminococcaceae bacterium]|nr:hypothetical protein [Oscillospiraceae bacterium]